VENIGPKVWNIPFGRPFDDKRPGESRRWFGANLLRALETFDGKTLC
jgi:hypothetical protein